MNASEFHNGDIVYLVDRFFVSGRLKVKAVKRTWDDNANTILRGMTFGRDYFADPTSAAEEVERRRRSA
ncbi:MAG: hypothetical protein GXY05_16635 [Clostridiales bacterium]|mgnify:CR=1 FL=1|nr:hypothetical protein [Clostridiales bacterium]